MADRGAVVIGGGISGILVARELAAAGWSVRILEGAHIGAGSSSRTAAGIRQQFSTASTVMGMRYSVRAYRELSQEIEAGQLVIIQNGYLFLHGEQQAWDRALAGVALQHGAGLAEVEALEGEALFSRFPWVDRDVCIGGTWCPSDGFLLPGLIYQEGARLCRAAGVEIVQGAPVTDATVVGDRIVSVTTPKGEYAADLFLDCTNAWTVRTGEALGATRLPVAPIKRYLWFIARDGGMSGEAMMRMPLTITPSGVYSRPENPDLLMMGWGHEARPEPNFTLEDQDRIEPEFAHNTGIDAKPFEAWLHMAEAVPLIGEFAGVVATTSGYYGTTPDHNPFLGYDPLRSNLIRLVGFSGHGAMFGPFTARVGLALAEAGNDLDTLELPEGTVSLGDFAIGRSFGHREAMVI